MLARANVACLSMQAHSARVAALSGLQVLTRCMPEWGLATQVTRLKEEQHWLEGQVNAPEEEAVLAPLPARAPLRHLSI